MGRGGVNQLNGNAGKGRWKKQMSFCNEMDRVYARDCNIDLSESEQTSIWSFITRELEKPS